jgi:hypothetical protein
MKKMPGKKPVPVLERLFMKLDTSGECWLYLGATNGKGYGVIGDSIPTRRMRYVHRIMFEAAHGPVPEDSEVAHVCDVRNCVRPSHLVAMTHDGNVQDMVTKNRQQRGERQWRSVLTDAGVVDIRRRVARGERRRDLAIEYGVSLSNIDLIVTRKRWVHVP